jgi:hypothetical protein
LDEVHPFSDTTGIDVVLREAELLMSDDMLEVGPKNANRIWGFLSKFVMLDRFGKTLGAAELYPADPITRMTCYSDYFGTASKGVSFFFADLWNLLICFSDIRTCESTYQTDWKIFEIVGEPRKEPNAIF